MQVMRLSLAYSLCIYIALPNLKLRPFKSYCAITGAKLNTRGFVYFHGAAPEFEASVIKDSMGPNAWSFQDLCWQRKEDPAEMQLSRGYQHVCDELEVHHMLLC